MRGHCIFPGGSTVRGPGSSPAKVSWYHPWRLVAGADPSQVRKKIDIYTYVHTYIHSHSRTRAQTKWMVHT